MQNLRKLNQDFGKTDHVFIKKICNKVLLPYIHLWGLWGIQFLET